MRNHKVIIWIVILLAVVGISVGIFKLIEYTPSIKEAIILATTVKPETFTELYFEDHLSLPVKIILFNENKFKFTIHNLENKDMAYGYEVYLDLNGEEKQIIDNNSVLIKSNEYKTITESFTIKVPIRRVRVVVSLVDKNQQIAFWMGEEITD